MENFNIFFLSILNISYLNSIRADETCGREMLAVNARAISGEILQTRAGITDGSPFLNIYLNQARFVQITHESCTLACFW